MMFYCGLNLFFGGNMKRKLIAFLIVCTIMLTGCGSGGGSSSDSKKLDNNSKVTKSNFKKFPTTDSKLFEYTLADDGTLRKLLLQYQVFPIWIRLRQLSFLIL